MAQDDYQTGRGGGMAPAGPSMPNIDEFIRRYGAGERMAESMGSDPLFANPVINRVWRTAYPDLPAVPELPPIVRGGDGASHAQMRSAIINDFLLRFQAGFDINTINFIRDVDRLEPAALVPHYRYVMYNTDDYRRSELVESETITRYWEEQRQLVRDEAARAMMAPPIPLTTEEQYEQDRSEFWTAYASRRPPVTLGSHGEYLGAQQYLGELVMAMQRDPRFMNPEFEDVAKLIVSDSKRLSDEYHQLGNDIVFRGEARANQAVAGARIAALNDQAAVRHARLEADINLGRAKFDYDIIKGERDFGERLLVDDYMNMLRKERAEDQLQDQLMQQRRLVNQNNTFQVRQAGQDYADLMRQNAQALATHARGLDENLLKYGGNLVPGGLEYTPRYEPGGAVEALFNARPGLRGTFRPQRTEDLVPFQQELPLLSLARLLGSAQAVHPYATGVPQSEVPGLPYGFQQRPELPDFLPLGMRERLAQRAEEEGYFGSEMPEFEWSPTYNEDEEEEI